MSGHSKWAKLKHFKGALDAQKSALFTKIAHMITVAVREGGADPETNFKLRLAIEKARSANMPKDNISRAIDRGLGRTKEAELQEVIYEVFLPEGAALIIEALTDNKARTAGAIRRILNKYGGTLGEKNSVLWMFEKKGVIRIVLDDPKEKKEEIELLAIDAGAEDIKEEGNEMVIYTKPQDLQKVKNTLEEKNLKIDFAEIEWFAKDKIKVSEEVQKKMQAIFSELDEDADINDYYSNTD